MELRQPPSAEPRHWHSPTSMQKPRDRSVVKMVLLAITAAAALIGAALVAVPSAEGLRLCFQLESCLPF